MRKHRDIKLVTTEAGRDHLVSEPNYHTIMKKTHIGMNKPVYLALSILELSKIVIYEFWYDQVKSKAGKEQIKKERTQTLGVIKDELRRKIVKEFAGLRANTFCYLIHEANKDKKAEGTKKCAMKRIPKFEDYKSCLERT